MTSEPECFCMTHSLSLSLSVSLNVKSLEIFHPSLCRQAVNTAPSRGRALQVLSFIWQNNLEQLPSVPCPNAHTCGSEVSRACRGRLTRMARWPPAVIEGRGGAIQIRTCRWRRAWLLIGPGAGAWLQAAREGSFLVVWTNFSRGEGLTMEERAVSLTHKKCPLTVPDQVEISHYTSHRRRMWRINKYFLQVFFSFLHTGI